MNLQQTQPDKGTICFVSESAPVVIDFSTLKMEDVEVIHADLKSKIVLDQWEQFILKPIDNNYAFWSQIVFATLEKLVKHYKLHAKVIIKGQQI